MNDMKITSGMLINAESLIDKAQNIQGFGTGDVINAAAKLVGVSDLLEIYNYFMGSGKDPEKIAKDIATSQVTDAAKEKLEDVLTDGGTLVLKGAGKFAFKLLFILPDLTEIGLDALTKYEDIKYTVTLGTEKMVMLEAFYQACNDRIAEKEKELGGWVIRFDKATATDTFTFWGISGLMSEWTLSGELIKSDIGESDGVAGTYTGSLNLDIRALDMKETFDARFLSEHNFSYVRQEMESWKHLTGGYVDTVNTNTVLSRSLSGEISAYVQPTSGMSDVNVSGDLASNDKIVFSFDHTIKGKNTSGTIYYSYVTQITSSNPNTINRSYKLSQITNVPMAGTSETVNFDEYSEGAPADIGTVWEPLESEISMTINFGR